MDPRQDLESFYGLLADLRHRLGGARYLGNCDGRSGWPQRGLYFFFDEQEQRGSGDSLRVVRVGTHALLLGSQTTLWYRLKNHKGNPRGRHPGGGNHRGSVFRFHVGAALLIRDGDPGRLLPIWMDRSRRLGETRELEYEVECRVSRYISSLPFLWLGVLDEAGPASDRWLIERNTIALLSRTGHATDPPRKEWLGHHAPSRAIGRSGLWNVDHVGEDYDPAFIEILKEYLRQI